MAPIPPFQGKLLTIDIQVRVIWVASSATEGFAEDKVGIRPEAATAAALESKSPMMRYWLSKVGNWAHGAEYALRQRPHGVVSVPLNPGNLDSDLYREHGLAMKLAAKLLMYPPLSGAYTELYAGLSPDITIEKTGCWGEFSVTSCDYPLSLVDGLHGGGEQVKTDSVY